MSWYVRVHGGLVTGPMTLGAACMFAHGYHHVFAGQPHITTDPTRIVWRPPA